MSRTKKGLGSTLITSRNIARIFAMLILVVSISILITSCGGQSPTTTIPDTGEVGVSNVKLNGSPIAGGNFNFTDSQMVITWEGTGVPSVCPAGTVGNSCKVSLAEGSNSFTIDGHSVTVICKKETVVVTNPAISKNVLINGAPISEGMSITQNADGRIKVSWTGLVRPEICNGQGSANSCYVELGTGSKNITVNGTSYSVVINAPAPPSAGLVCRISSDAPVPSGKNYHLVNSGDVVSVVWNGSPKIIDNATVLGNNIPLSGKKILTIREDTDLFITVEQGGKRETCQTLVKVRTSPPPPPPATCTSPVTFSAGSHYSATVNEGEAVNFNVDSLVSNAASISVPGQNWVVYANGRLVGTAPAVNQDTTYTYVVTANGHSPCPPVSKTYTVVVKDIPAPTCPAADRISFKSIGVVNVNEGATGTIDLSSFMNNGSKVDFYGVSGANATLSGSVVSYNAQQVNADTTYTINVTAYPKNTLCPDATSTVRFKVKDIPAPTPPSCDMGLWVSAADGGNFSGDHGNVAPPEYQGMTTVIFGELDDHWTHYSSTLRNIDESEMVFHLYYTSISDAILETPTTHWVYDPTDPLAAANGYVLKPIDLDLKRFTQYINDGLWVAGDDFKIRAEAYVKSAHPAPPLCYSQLVAWIKPGHYPSLK